MQWSSGLCAPACADGEISPGETSSTVAGGALRYAGDECDEAIDRPSGMCDADLMRCLATSCADGIKNGDETDVTAEDLSAAFASLEGCAHNEAAPRQVEPHQHVPPPSCSTASQITMKRTPIAVVPHATGAIDCACVSDGDCASGVCDQEDGRCA